MSWFLSGFDWLLAACDLLLSGCDWLLIHLTDHWAGYWIIRLITGCF